MLQSKLLYGANDPITEKNSSIDDVQNNTFQKSMLSNNLDNSNMLAMEGPPFKREIEN